MDFSAPQTKACMVVGALTVALCALITYASVPKPQVEAAPSPASDIAGKLEAQAKQYDELQHRIRQLEIFRRAQEARYTFASFEPTDEAYQRVDSGMGSFAVSIKDLKPYGDGTKLTVELGNPSAATFRGVKLFFEYGPKLPDIGDPEFSKKMEFVDANTKKKEHELLKPVLGGSWNPNEVILAGVKPDELGWIEIRASANQIALH